MGQIGQALTFFNQPLLYKVSKAFYQDTHMIIFILLKVYRTKIEFIKQNPRFNIMSEKISFSSDDNIASTETLLKKGIALRMAGSPRHSILYFDKILKIEPSHIEALVNKGNSLGRLGKYHEAIVCYDKVLKINPNRTLALINKGLSFHYLGQYDDAISCYDKILEINPQHANTLYHKACSVALQNDASQAITLLEKAIDRDSTFGTKADCDLDFINLRQSEQFKKLVKI